MTFLIFLLNKNKFEKDGKTKPNYKCPIKSIPNLIVVF